MTVLPDPEPDWRPALSYQGGNSNPVRQRSMWDRAARNYREIAILRLKLRQIADRLRLHLETGFDELGNIEAAFIEIGDIDFVVYRYHPDQGVLVDLHRGVELTASEALDRLLSVLGADRGVIAALRQPDGTWETMD